VTAPSATRGPSGEGKFDVVVCGGGIAGAEGLLRLHSLAGNHVSLTLVTPNDEFVYRPLTVREPFALGEAGRESIPELARAAEATWVTDKLAWVDRAGKMAHTEQGEAIAYDALLLAVGARPHAPFDHALVFDDAHADTHFHGLLQDIEGGYIKRIAFVAPDGPCWPLPLYELALMTAERANGLGLDDVELSLITPDAAPLIAFGGTAVAAVEKELARAGIALYTSAAVKVPEPGSIVFQPRGALRVDRIVTLPRIAGPSVRGIPGGERGGFLPIDAHCRVRTAENVFAAGDATNFPIKHGGLGAQQADTAAAGIAALAGADVTPEPYDPVIYGKLLTGRDPLYLTARIVAGSGFSSEVSLEPQWPADKVVAEELGRFRAARNADGPATAAL
jgi:sulfide:quinone oxidoreductase